MKTAVDDAFAGRQALEEERWTFKLEEIRGGTPRGASPNGGSGTWIVGPYLSLARCVRHFVNKRLVIPGRVMAGSGVA